MKSIRVTFKRTWDKTPFYILYGVDEEEPGLFRYITTHGIWKEVNGTEKLTAKTPYELSRKIRKHFCIGHPLDPVIRMVKGSAEGWN